MSGIDVRLVRGTDDDLALVAPLWRSMVEHHRQVAGDGLPVRGADDAWTMRRREYRAWLDDGSGALLLGTGEPLARALEKIEVGAKRIPMDVNPAQAQAYIVNPLTGRQMSFAKMFMTHPPTEERVARLRQMDPGRGF